MRACTRHTRIFFVLRRRRYGHILVLLTMQTFQVSYFRHTGMFADPPGWRGSRILRTHGIRAYPFVLRRRCHGHIFVLLAMQTCYSLLSAHGDVC